jgi:hypothetical protein
LLRLLVFLLLAYVVYLVIKAYLASGGRLRRRDTPPLEGEEMVLDPQCHSYVPKREAFLQGDRYFCSEECARLYLGR